MKSAQYERMRGILGRVTYKPGWKIEVTQPVNVMGDLCLIVTMNVPDLTKRDGSMTTFLYHEHVWLDRLESMSDCEVVDKVIGNALRKCEMHELDEWYKVDSINVREPHPELMVLR